MEHYTKLIKDEDLGPAELMRGRHGYYIPGWPKQQYPLVYWKEKYKKWGVRIIRYEDL